MNHEVLLNQIDFVRKVTLKVLKDVTEEMADIVPEGFNNSIRWNIGHIFIDQYMWLYFKIPDELKLPDQYKELFGFGTKPADWKIQPPSLEELKALLRQQPVHIRQTFGHRLDEKLIEPTELGMSTIGEVIPRTLYHEGLHVGTILSIKKVIQAQHLIK
jgi:hypothetical protein